MSKTKISNLTHMEFPSTLNGSFLTTTDVSKYVNTLFSKIFADYKGCVITIDQSADPNNPQVQMSQNYPVQCQLYFAVGESDPDDKRLRAFELMTEANKVPEKTKDSMNFIARTMSYQMAMTQNKTCCVTQDAVDILSELLWYDVKRNIPKDPTPKVFNERGIALETCTSNTSQQNMFVPVDNGRIIYGVIRYIDLAEIFHLLFGDDEDSRCYYQVMPVKPVVPMMPGMTPMMTSEQKWLVCVNKLSEKGVRDLMTELGTTVPTIGPNISTSVIG